MRDRDSVEFAAANAVEQSRAFHQIIARQRKQSPLGCPGHRMPRTTDPLQEGGDGAWRAELADQIDIADIDAEFERGSRHQGFQLAVLESLLRR